MDWMGWVTLGLLAWIALVQTFTLGYKVGTKWHDYVLNHMNCMTTLVMELRKEIRKSRGGARDENSV